MRSGYLPGEVHEFFNHLLVRQHAVEVGVHDPPDNLAEFLRLDDIRPAIDLNFLCDQFFQEFHSEVLLFHLRYFLEKIGIEERKFPPRIGKEIDDAPAFDALLQKLVNALVHFRQRYFSPASLIRQSDDKHPHGFKEGRFKAHLFRHKRRTEGQSLTEHQRFLDEGVPILFPAAAEDEVYRSADGFRPLEIAARGKRGAVKTVEQAAAD